ncbi:MAG TPA: RdgB/HAM1 family non-canonical purine NTP pyrophosphatase [Chroococcales cyanobacterium]
MKIFLASGNAHKIEEFRKIFADGPLDFEGIPVSVEENGISFAENALIKAKKGCEISGQPTLADDSGLSVDSLEGRPGIHSARYGGEKATSREKIEKLLLEMKDLPDEKRSASFHCALALVFPDGSKIEVEGVCPGFIARECSGEGGFGYDPVFHLPEIGKTFAQLSNEEKNLLGHRGKAARLLLAALKERLPQK